MKIPLTQGQFALVDKRDFHKVNKLKWRLTRSKNQNYAIRSIKIEKDKYGQESLHRFLLGKTKKGFVIDHINGNGLDNRRKNLRVCSIADNVRNQKIARSNTGIKGVSLFRNGKYIVKIMYKRKGIHLGYFTNRKEAEKAYIKAARKYFGKFSPV